MWDCIWEAESASKSIITNLYMDCDTKTAAEIIGAVNHETLALCRLDSEIPLPKSLVLIQGSPSEVTKAYGMIEQQLKRFHKEMSGLKLMHVAIEGVGSVEVCVIHG